MRASAQAFCSVDRVSPSTVAPRSRGRDRARLPQPQPISSSRSPGLASSRSSSSVDLAVLRRLQRCRRGEQRARIGHPRVEPCGSRNRCRGRNARRCSRAPGAGYCRAGVGHALIQPARPLGAAASPSGRALAHEQFEQRHRIGARPFAAPTPYQPTEPEVASRTSARQLWISTHRHRPRRWPPSRRCEPSGRSPRSRR